MNRNQKLKANMISSLVLQLSVFASGIILPRLFIEFYGSKTNGLISSIQQFLGFISLGEMGIGAVIQFNLYKPLAENNWSRVSSIITSANKFFSNLLKCIVVYIIILSALLPFKVLDQFPFFFTFTLVLSIALSYIMQYYFGMTYRQLLDADQLSFVRIIPQIFQIIINIIVCIFLIKIQVNVQIVKLVTSLIYSIQPLAIYIYCKKYYPNIRTNIKLSEEPIKQKWNGIAQHLAAVVLKDTDVVVLTLLSSLENVSVYSVYNLVINGIEVIIESVVNNFTALFGELLAKSKIDELKKKFDLFESIYHCLIIIVFFCIGRLIVPFVEVYTKGITDANYKTPLFAILLTFAQWLYCARLPYHIMVKAAGHYKETQNSAIIEATLNIVISVATVYVWGLVGVALGTAIAMLYRSIYYWIYLKKNVLNRPLKKVISIYFRDLVIVGLSTICTSWLELVHVSYLSWIMLACGVFVITSVIAFVVLIITDKKNVISLLKHVIIDKK